MAALSQNEEREAIMKAVGLALDQWSHVELALEDLFANTLGIQEGPAHVVLSSIRSFNARILVVNNLITALAIDPEIRARWSALHNRLSKKNDKRNELAHFTILNMTENGKETVRLKPYYSTGGEVLRGTRDFSKPNPPGLDLTQVGERANSFSALAMDVWMISRELREFLEQRRAFLEQARRRDRVPDTD